MEGGWEMVRPRFAGCPDTGIEYFVGHLSALEDDLLEPDFRGPGPKIGPALRVNLSLGHSLVVVRHVFETPRAADFPAV